MQVIEKKGATAKSSGENPGPHQSPVKSSVRHDGYADLIDFVCSSAVPHEAYVCTLCVQEEAGVSPGPVAVQACLPGSFMGWRSSGLSKLPRGVTGSLLV
jgi:hypothetical protein